jgi:hypothetical protein
MTPLPTNITEAIKSGNTADLRFVDPETQKVYFLLDDETHRRAMDAIRQQDDWDAIEEGVAQAKRGESISADELKVQIRNEFGFDV